MTVDSEQKAALKKLRRQRKEIVAAAAYRLKAQNATIRRIKAHLAQNAATVPQIAAATGMQTDRVLWYVAALKKYGEIVEAEKDGAYFRYALTSKGRRDPDATAGGAT